MSKQKRYTTEAEILAEIERCKTLGQKANADALFKEREIKNAKEFVSKHHDSDDEKKRSHAAYFQELIPEWRLEVGRLNRRAERYLETRMETMKDVLARFRTTLLPVEGNTDESVVE